MMGRYCNSSLFASFTADLEYGTQGAECIEIEVSFN